jgi:hypothetical protein
VYDEAENRSVYFWSSPKWRDRNRDAATRAFYQAVGFLPIEEFPDLWGAENPCLLMLRPLSNRP